MNQVATSAKAAEKVAATVIQPSKRLQNGGRQTVVVQHLQQVQVNNSGQAMVNGTTKTKSRKGGGHKE